MRSLPICLVLLGGSAAWAQDRTSGPIGDFEDFGEVIVYDAAPVQGAVQAPPGAEVPEVSPDQYYADDGQYLFYGAHPDGEGGWDTTEGPHTHDYAPFDPYLFTQENGYNYFIGDPGDFGYQGNDLYPYFGPHPVALVYGGGYCYYPGAHRHRFAPWGNRFVNSNGWLVYHGPVSPWFNQYRGTYAQYFREVYPRRVQYVRDHRGTPPPRTVVAPVQRMVINHRAGVTHVAPPAPARAAPIVRDHRH